MPANTDPIYSVAGEQSNNGTTGMNQMVTAAANDYTGIDADVSLVFTAGANGSFVRGLRFKAGGTNVASCARVYLNNGATVGTATNNTFWTEISLPATTASASVATAEIFVPLNIALKAGWKIYFGLATAVSAGWNCNAEAGNY